VIDRIAKGYFSTAHPNPFQGLINTLLDRDEHLLLADYPFYVHCQDRLGQIYSDPERWTQLSILNTARMGELSWDRIIHDYCQEIWRIHAVPIQRREFEWV
jgi:starch phosphorylase